MSVFDVIILLVIVFLLYHLFKPTRKKAFEVITPPDMVSEEDRSRLYYKLSGMEFPPAIKGTTCSEYFTKLLPYMVMRCRMVGFPKGSVIILRAQGKEYKATL